MTYIPAKVKTDLTTPNDLDLASESLVKSIGLSGQDFEIRADNYPENSVNNGRVWFNTTSNKLVCCQNGVLKELKMATGGSSGGLIGTRTANGDIIFARVGSYYLACAPASKRTQKQWGLSETNTGLTDAGVENRARDYEGTSPYFTPKSGFSNSQTLDSYGASAEANQWCRDQTGASYFLPSKEELLLMYLNMALIDSLDVSGGTYTFNYLAQATCWSSTECDITTAYIMYMKIGFSQTSLKSASAWVCPCTRIPA